MQAEVVKMLAEGVVKPCISRTVELADLVGPVSEQEPCAVGKVVMVPASY